MSLTTLVLWFQAEILPVMMEHKQTFGYVASVIFGTSLVPMTAKAIWTVKTDVPYLSIIQVIIASTSMIIYGLLISSHPILTDMGVTFTAWAIMLTVKCIQDVRASKGKKGKDQVENKTQEQILTERVKELEDELAKYQKAS